MNCDDKCKNVNTCCDKCYSDYLHYKKEILSAESYFDEHAYTLGRKAKEDDNNPFLKNTNSWYNWNKGKNEKFLDEILPIQNK